MEIATLCTLVCLLPNIGLCAATGIKPMSEASMWPRGEGDLTSMNERLLNEAGMRTMEEIDGFEDVEAEIEQAVGPFRYVGPGFTHVTASVNYFWGASPFGVYRCNRPCAPGQWVYVPNILKQVDASDQEVWGVNVTGEIFKRPVDGSGQWESVPGSLKYVSASGNGYIWGVSANDRIFKCKKPCSGQWEAVDGLLKQIDGGQSYVYGVNSANQVFLRPVDGSGSWRLIPGRQLKHVTASADSYIYGIDLDNRIYSCQKPCLHGSYTLVNGRLSQVDGTFNAIVGSLVNTAFMHSIHVP